MASDDILQLQQPLKDGGIRNVNFFNGRLLSGKDLSREQEARRESGRRLSLALGEGVAYGLEVARDDTPGLPAGTYVTVRTGLAINRLGQALHLARDTRVALTRQYSATGLDGCAFGLCAPLVGGTYVAGAGVYVLTLAPSAATEGRAPANGLDPSNVRCNTDANVEALQFRLLMLTPAMLAGIDFGSAALRNELAYRCFGAGIQPDWFAGLLTAPARTDDLVVALRGIGLGEQEVPLVLLVFRAAGLEFIDNWAVRRPLHRAESGGLAGLLEERRAAVGRAMAQQFRQHIAELGAPLLLPPGVTAASHFRFLPPAGVIPVPEESDGSDAAATRFFAGLRYRAPVHIHGAQLEALLAESLLLPPIDTRGGEMLWLYRVRENRMAIALGAAPRPTGYLVFASGHLPYRGDARFDLARFDFANYALTP